MLRNGSAFNILRIRHAAHISVRYICTYITYMRIYTSVAISLCVCVCVFNATAVEANGKSDTKRLQQRQRQRQSMKWAGRGKPPCKCITHTRHTHTHKLYTLAHINISLCSPWTAYLSYLFSHWREISS